MEMLIDRQTDKNRQRNRPNYTNFESNLAMMVIYPPVKFDFDWIKHFELESRNGNNGKQTNGQTNRRNCTNLEINLAMMVIYFPVKFEFDWTKCFRVRVRKRKC